MRLTLAKGQFVNQISGHAVCRNIEPHGTLASSIERVFRRFAALQIADVSGPHPGRLIGKSTDKSPLGLEREGMILMAGAIRDVSNPLVIGKWLRLVDAGSARSKKIQM